MPIQESSFRFVRETESVATAAQINPLFCLRKLIFAKGEAAAPNGGSVWVRPVLVDLLPVPRVPVSRTPYLCHDGQHRRVLSGQLGT